MQFFLPLTRCTKSSNKIVLQKLNGIHYLNLNPYVISLFKPLQTSNCNYKTRSNHVSLESYI